MNGTNLFKIALRALANNKLRAFLTMLGIIIGVESAELVVGKGDVYKRQEEVYPASYIWHHARNPKLYASLVS